MKLLNDLSFLLKYYDREDLQYFYEQLQTRVERFLRKETVDNDRLTGYIWKLMSVCIERSAPQRKNYTRLSKKHREDFKDLAAKKICELTKTYDDPLKLLSKSEKDAVLLSIFSMKLLVAISEQDELF